LIEKEIRELEQFLFLTEKCQANNLGTSKKGKSALKEISHMMKYSNNMENNIQNLNIKRVLEQEFAEKSLQVEGFSELDNEVGKRFASFLGKRDSEFFNQVHKLKRARQITDE
jgi:hypothetical protein